MFFSPELLSKRDGGFGLLWLAATLGSKSTFKKLPKRSVLTADISQLCGLISDPSEPLALRLSSNLMVGVARVYKVKQEIFLTDITNCVASLKKALQDSLNYTHATNTQLQMTQTSVRPSAFTLTADPRTQFVLDFDALVADWDEYLNIRDASRIARSDDGMDLEITEAKQKASASLKTEVARRQEMHTLAEHHEHLLSASFDLSNSSGGAAGPSPSQVSLDFVFDNNFLNPSGGLLDFGGLGDELEKELGWGPSQAENKELDLDGDFQMDGLSSGIDFGPELFPQVEAMSPIQNATVCNLQSMSPSMKRKTTSVSDKENHLRSPSHLQLDNPLPLSPATSFSYRLLSQDEHMTDIVVGDNDRVYPVAMAANKVKRTRLLLDARTELTDDELKTARAQYMQAQDFLRQEMKAKFSERYKGRMIEEMVWGVPSLIQAPTLANFWQENFKVQVDARSGTLRIHLAGEPPRKRRRTTETSQNDAISIVETNQADIFEFNNVDDMDMDINVLVETEAQWSDAGLRELPELDHIRSSEEPGQGRRISRPPSIVGDSGFDLGVPYDLIGSQKSSLFPWDNAGMSSSSGPPGLPGSDQIHVDPIELKLRGSSQSRRSSSLIPSQVGSLAERFSPAPIRQTSQDLPEDYVFEMETQDRDGSPRLETQKSDLIHISLERNSFNFLEYARMQWQSLPYSASNFTFDIIVPQTSSTRHVAAAALYHCLVLATKAFLHLEQHNPYGPVSITIIA